MVGNQIAVEGFCLLICLEVNSTWRIVQNLPISTRKEHSSPVWYVVIAHMIFSNNQHLGVTTLSELQAACLEVNPPQVFWGSNKLLRVSKIAFL